MHLQDLTPPHFYFKLIKHIIEGEINGWFAERRACKAVICHLDKRNSTATRAFSDVRRATEIKPELAGLIVKSVTL